MNQLVDLLNKPLGYGLYENELLRF